MIANVNVPWGVRAGMLMVTSNVTLVGALRGPTVAGVTVTHEVEAGVGPEQELVEGGLAVDEADLRGCDLAPEEPDLASAIRDARASAVSASRQ